MKTTKTTKVKTATPKTIVKASAKAPAAKALAVAPEPKRSVKVAATKPPVAKVSASPAATRREISTDLIAARAYIIWEQQGRPHGRDLANWLLAESQLLQEIQSFTA